jgi:hypothetical protein
MKTIAAHNFWTKEPVEVTPFNTHGFHRVNFRSDDLIIGFFEDGILRDPSKIHNGNRSAETLTDSDVEFLTGYYCRHNEFDNAVLAYDIVGRENVPDTPPGMRDTFLRIRARRPHHEQATT